jgi:hypothetical protein
MISKAKVTPEMKRVYQDLGIWGGRHIYTPTGRYEVRSRNTDNVVCVCKFEFVAESLAMLLENHVDEWNEIVDEHKAKLKEREKELT